MTDQGKVLSFRKAVTGLALMGLAATLSGCAAGGGVNGGPAPTVRPSNAEFAIAFDTNVAGDLAVSVTPDDGDASLESKKSKSGDKDNTIVWTAGQTFGIKFVQIDDPAKSPKKKFGDESVGWNQATCNDAGTSCVYQLNLEAGKGNQKKEIRAAKYVVASPSGCSDAVSIPAGCMWQDPVIIVRY